MQPRLTFVRWLVDTSERAVTTLAQCALAFALAAPQLDANGGQALIAALIPFALTVAVCALTLWWVPPPSTFTVDVIWRTFGTWLIAFVGLLIADGVDLVDGSTRVKAFIAGFAAVMVPLKCRIAYGRPNQITPASLAPARWVDE